MRKVVGISQVPPTVSKLNGIDSAAACVPGSWVDSMRKVIG